MRQAFARDNVHLTSREEEGATRAFAKCLADLGQQVGEVVLMLSSIPEKIENIFATLTLSDGAAAGGDGGAGGGVRGEGNTMTIVDTDVPMHDASGASGALSGDEAGVMSVGTPGPGPGVSVGAPAPVSALSRIMHTPAHVANAPEGDNYSNVAEFYFATMRRGGEIDTRGVEKQEVLRRRLVMKMFNAMATDEEQLFIKSG